MPNLDTSKPPSRRKRTVILGVICVLVIVASAEYSVYRGDISIWESYLVAAVTSTAILVIYRFFSRWI